MKKILSYFFGGLVTGLLIVTSVAQAAAILFPTGGGTGWGSTDGVNGGLQAHTVLIGNGVNRIATTSPSSAGFVLTSNGIGADPTFQAATGGSSAFPFTPATGYNATSTAIGFLAGLFSNSSTTLNGAIRFPSLSSGSLAVDTAGQVYSWATTTDIAFSTTSANFWASAGLAFSTTSENYYKSVNNFFSTTSANFWSSAGLAFSTTSSNYWSLQGLGFSTTSAIYFVHSSTTIPKTYTNNSFTGTNIFNASTTMVNATTTGTSYSTIASTTLFYETGLRDCVAGEVATYALGKFSCVTDQTSAGAAAPFVWTTNYDVITAATSSILNATAGIQASSTSHFATLDFIAATSSGLSYFRGGLISSASSTFSSGIRFAGQIKPGDCTNSLLPCYSDNSGITGMYFPAASQIAWSIGTAQSMLLTSGGLTLVSLTDGLVKSTAGLLSNATPGVDFQKNFDWTPTINYGVNTNATSTAISLFGGVNASSTSNFDKINIGSSTSGTMATSTDFGNLVVSGNASTTLLTVSSAGGVAGCATFSSTGQISNTGTACGTSASSFSTTSANWWASLGLAFSTTSTDYWKTQNNFFSTTSANYWSSIGLAFSTTSSNAWSAQGLGFSTTSSNAWSAQGLGFSTTSANYWNSIGLAFSTTSANAWSAVGLGFSTTSATYFAHSSTTIPKTYTTNTFTLLNTFVAGLISQASSTIGNGTQQGGLTISGGATTTGNAAILGALTIGTSTGINTSGATLVLYNTNTSGASPALTLQGNVAGDTDFWIGRTNNNDTVSNDSLTFGLGVVPGTTPAWTLNYQMQTGIGSTSPYAKLSVHGNPTDSFINTTLFAIGSSTASATSTFFTVLNTGATTISSTGTSTFKVTDAFGGMALNVNTSSTTGPIFTVWATTTPASVTICGGVGSYCLFSVDQYGHIAASSTQPTLSSCGTSPSLSADSNDSYGTITVGSVSATACTFTYGIPHTIGSHCVVQNQTGSVTNTFSYTESLTGFVVSETALTGNKLSYACHGQ